MLILEYEKKFLSQFTFVKFLILIGLLTFYKFFNYWVYPIYTHFPFSKSWFISSPGDGINLVASSRDTDEIGKVLLSNKKLFLVNGYSVDRNVVRFNSNLFSSRQFSFNGQECSEGHSCEEIPIGTKFIIKKIFHLKHLRTGGFFNSDYDMYIVTDASGHEIELYSFLLDYFNLN